MFTNIVKERNLHKLACLCSDLFFSCLQCLVCNYSSEYICLNQINISKGRLVKFLTSILSINNLFHVDSSKEYLQTVLVEKLRKLKISIRKNCTIIIAMQWSIIP